MQMNSPHKSVKKLPWRKLNLAVIACALLASFGGTPAWSQTPEGGDRKPEIKPPRRAQREPGPPERPGAPPPGAPHLAPRELDGPMPPRERVAGPPMWNRLSEEERERIREFMRLNFPGVFEELEQMRQERREQFEKRIRRVIPDMWELMDLMEIDPQRGQLMIKERRIDMDLRRLGAKFRMSKDEADKERVQKEMSDLGQQAFEVRHQREALEIQDIESRLQELKDRHTAAEEDRDQWVEDHVRQRMEQPFEPGGKPPIGQRP